MGRHGVAEPPLPADKPLKEHAANDAGQPFAVLETESHGRDDERNSEVIAQRDALEIFFGDVPVQEWAKENLFQRRHDQGRADDARYGEELRHIGLERLVWIPGCAAQFQLEETGINPHDADKFRQPNPNPEA